MFFNSHLKDEKEESSLIQRRLFVISGFIAFLTAILVGRIRFLQISNFKKFSALSEDNRVSLVAVPPDRGEIRDRKGRLLAENTAVYTLEARHSKDESLDETLDRLSKIVSFTPWELKKAKQAARESARFEKFTLKFNLTEKEVALFSVNQHLFQNVVLQGVLQRFYPYAGELAHVVGYVGRISKRDLEKIDKTKYRGVNYIGRLGIESSYEKVLLGKPGFEQVEQNAHGRTIRVLNKNQSVPGQDLQMYLDIELQKAAREALSDYRGSVVAIDPQTGGVLAFVSTPIYDPNEFVNGIDHDNYSVLRDDINKPLLNRSMYGRYAPGSTVKGVFALAGMQNGFNQSTRVFCPGWYSLRGKKHRYRCWNHNGHGSENYVSAITESCDVYFYHLANTLGIDKISKFMKQFGIGKKTGIDLDFEPTGLMPSKKWKRKVHKTVWYPGETVITGIGQGYMLMTPVQLATVATTLANRGKIKQPKLVQGNYFPKQDPLVAEKTDLETIGIEKSDVEKANKFIAEQILPASKNSPRDYENVIEAMRLVVHGKKGTARRIGKGIDYEIAGKTGTAQVVGIPQGAKYDAEKLEEFKRDHSLFMGFAPVENPRIALAVIVENGGSGSKVAAPIARKVFDKYFEEFGGVKTGPTNDNTASNEQTSDISQKS